MRHALLVSAVAIGSFAPASYAGITGINVTFGVNWMNNANWNNNAALRMRAEAVVMQAKSNWENAITDLANYNLAVEVDWAAPLAFFNMDSGACGVGGISATQMVNNVEKPKTAKIILNSMLLGNPPGGANGNWFIDPTPAMNEEYALVNANEPWRAAPKGNMNFHPGVVSGEHRNRADMLSCAKHEFGHTLGFHAAAFPPYSAEIMLEMGDPGPDVDVLDFNGIALAVGAADLNVASHFAANGMVPGTMIPMNHLLMVPSPPDTTFRTFMSPYDVSGVAKVLGLPLAGMYNLNPKDPAGGPVQVPSLSAAGAAGAAMLMLLATGYALRRRV
jgi:hypothetical protein